MKLREIFKNAININEAWDTKFDEIEWFTTPSGYAAKARRDNDLFELYLDSYTYTAGSRVYNWVNIAVSRFVNSEKRQDILGLPVNQSKNIGCVINGLRDGMKKYVGSDTIDAIVFMVKPGEERRVSIYEKLLHSNILRLSSWKVFKKVESQHGTFLIAIQSGMTKDERDGLEAQILSHGKILT